MQFKFPKNDDKYQWTDHVKGKMVYYGISEGLIKRIVRFPKRKEIGVAPKTIAVMQPTSSKKQEIWVMYQPIESRSWNLESGNKHKDTKIFSQIPPTESLRDPTGQANSKFQIPKIRIISAWRYPGVSPVGKKIPIPDEILQELGDLIE